MKTKKRIEWAQLWNSYKVWVGLLAVLLVAVVIFLYIYKGAIIPAAGTAVTESAIEVTGEDRYLFEGKEGRFELRQSFFCTVPQMMGFGIIVQPANNEDYIEKLTAHVLFLDGMTKEYIFDKDIVLEDIGGPKYLSVLFDDVLKDTQDNYYELVINFKGDGAERIAVVGTSDNTYEYLQCQLNQVEIPQAIGIDQYIEYGHFIINLFKGFVILFCLFIIIFWIMVFIKKCRMESVYLFTVLALGFFYCCVIIPFGVPDESMHASSVYRIANDIMGVEETGNGDTIYKRYDDAALQLNNDCNLKQYYLVYKNMFKTVEKSELFETGYRDTNASPILYAPSILGVVLGRILRLGTVPMYMLARLLTLIAFALLTYWAMIILPFGKVTLFIIGILPMTLQQAASLSYDAMINAITILFTAVSISMIFGKEERIRIRTLALTAILGLFMIFAKGGAYLPMVLLLLLIPASKLGGSKKKWLIFGGFIAILAAAFLFNSIVMLAEDSSGAAGAVENYSLSYILRHPGSIFNIGVGTLLLNSGYYISTMIGQRLGFLNIISDDIVVFGFLFLMMISILKCEGEQFIFSAKQKLITFVSILGCVGLVALSMWVFLTPVNSGVIQGIQGRYFIPVLWLALMLFRNNSIVVKKDIRQGLMTGAVFLHILVFAYVFRDIFLV